MSKPNPAQTASPFSAMFYVHLDAIVSKARKTLHLPLEELPPLADDDMANNLKEKHFKVPQYKFAPLTLIIYLD